MLQQIESRVQDGIPVVSLRGEFLGGKESGELFDKILHDYIEKGRVRIILDLAEVDSINSSALSILIHAWQKALDAGGNLKLANLTKKLESVLTISKLASVFGAYDSVEEAVESFKKES